MTILDGCISLNSVPPSVKYAQKTYVKFFTRIMKPPEEVVNFFLVVKVSKSRKQFMVSSILPKNERKLTILIIFFT